MDIGELLKRLTIIGPLFASSIAVCYDVGFFYGLNIAFFTFFSLAEHFVFALQSLPFAVIPMCWVASLILGTRLGFIKHKKEMADFNEKLPTMSLQEKQALLTKLNVKMRWNKVRDVVFLALMGGMVCWLAFDRHLYQAATWMAIVAVITKLIPSPEKLADPSRRFAVIAFSIVSSWVMAFAVGYERAENIISSKPTEIVSIFDSEIQSRIIRAGDRGLLILKTDTKQLRFLRWDEIKKIESKGT